MKDITWVAITVALVLGLVNLEQQRAADATATASANAAANAAATAEEARIEASYVDRGEKSVEHDGDPETGEYSVMLDGRGSGDPDGDKITWKWAQTGGRSVELSATDESIATFVGTAGEYSFSLTVTDSYGASSVSNRDLRIDAEGNIAPIADIKVYNR
tara:strand:+ start:3418 stop:3897 length:480 start_codon:yes stop_codon:yes gene_type:complete